MNGKARDRGPYVARGPKVSVVSGTIWVDYAAETGHDERHIPKALRESGDHIGHVNTLVATFGSEFAVKEHRILGIPKIAAALGISERSFKRHMKDDPEFQFIKKFGNLYGTLVNSAGHRSDVLQDQLSNSKAAASAGNARNPDGSFKKK